MNRNIVFEDWGLIAYPQALARQEEIFARNLQCKQHQREGGAGAGQLTQYLIFCEHPHVYTIGKSGKQQNLLVSDAFLQSVGATVHSTNRGGDITYHGPGQLVGYPIVDLELLELSIKEYIYLLEESVIELLSLYGINGMRAAGATGVWLDVGLPGERKICAIGVRASRSITMHGFALNVNTDLKYFSYINPCGFVDKGVTSMQQELSQVLDFTEVQEQLKRILIGNFKLHA